MNDGPPPLDPNDLTQPLPIVSPPPRGPVSGAVRQLPARYEHRFGNVPAYMLARLAAFLVDVPGVAFVLATFGFNAFDHGLFLIAGRDRAGFDTLALIALGAALVFQFLCEALFGTTLGKLLFGLHTRRQDGKHAGIGRALVRSLLRPIDILIVGPLLALVTPRHQRVGDFAAGTVVGSSSLRFFAPLLGIVLCLAIGYAQFAYGGGLTSALGVAAETGNYAPGAFAQFAALFGFAASGFAAKPAASPLPQPTVVPQATPAATAEPTPDRTPATDDTPEPQDSAAIIQQ